MLKNVYAFIARHEPSPARIAGATVAIVAHVLAYFVLTLPLMTPAEPSGPVEEEVVMVVEFIEGDGESARVPPPPPPPLHEPKTKPGLAANSQPAPPVDDGDELIAEDAGASTRLAGEGASAQDLQSPDNPPTEILSYRSSHPPVYPPEAIAAGESGWVTLRVLIDSNGIPLSFVLVKSTATDRLVEAAIDAIKQWRFNPAMRDGRAVQAWIEVPIGFYSQKPPSPSVAGYGEPYDGVASR